MSLPVARKSDSARSPLYRGEGVVRDNDVPFSRPKRTFELFPGLDTQAHRLVPTTPQLVGN